MRYGYIRVSTKEQNIDRQLTALSLENISKEQIFIDRASGKNFNRIEYQRLLTILQEDDDLVIKSIDRLGRNYDDILEQWKLLTKVKKVHLVVLDFPLLNTRNNIDTITGKLISDLVLHTYRRWNENKSNNDRWKGYMRLKSEEKDSGVLK